MLLATPTIRPKPSRGSSILLFDWFVVFLVDGVTNGVQQVMTVLTVTSSAATGGFSCRNWTPGPNPLLQLPRRADESRRRHSHDTALRSAAMTELPDQIAVRLNRLAEEFKTERPVDAAAMRTGAGALKALIAMGVRTSTDFARLMQDQIPKRDQ